MCLDTERTHRKNSRDENIIQESQNNYGPQNGEKRVNENIYEKDSLFEDFELLFSLLKYSGIDVGDFSKYEGNLDLRASRRNRNQKKCHVNTRFKYFQFFFLALEFFAVITSLFFMSYKREVFICSFFMILLILFYSTLYRKTKELLQMIQDLNGLFTKFSNYNPKPKTCLSKLILTFRASAFCMYKLFSLSPEAYQIDLLSMIVYGVCELHLLTMSSVISLFALYYCLVCLYIRGFFKHILEYHVSNCFSQQSKIIYETFVEVTNCMNHFEECFSFPAFTIVLMSMMELFYNGYSIAFDTSEYSFLVLISQLLSSLSHLLLIMVPASITNEAIKRAKCHLMSLQCEIPTTDKKLKFELRKCFLQENFLTLWNIYVLDRSLIITVCGTLLTYGILIGSLEKKTLKF